jgi:hypothetical protein
MCVLSPEGYAILLFSALEGRHRVASIVGALYRIISLFSIDSRVFSPRSGFELFSTN